MFTNSGHYFAFDKALERFGVKFVKQNIGERTMDAKELKLQISNVQSEWEWLDLLILEYYIYIYICILEIQTLSEKKGRVNKNYPDYKINIIFFRMIIHHAMHQTNKRVKRR